MTVRADFEVEGEGSNVDTIAFWEAPDPADSLMFVTSKNEPLLEVWRYPFDTADSEQEPLTHDCFEAGDDSATNGVLVDQETDLLYVASNFSPNVCVFSLPELAHDRTFTSGSDYGQEPNLALLELPGGEKRLYVSDDDVFHVHDAATGERLSRFETEHDVETAWADEHEQVLYVPDENGRTGVHVFEPDGTPRDEGEGNPFGSTVFDADAEGILAYACPPGAESDDGTGLLVVSDQVDDADDGNDYEVFDRATRAHLGTLTLELPDGEGLVFNTDGIASTQRSSPAYPAGLFTAIQDDDSVVGVGWDAIFAAVSDETGTAFGCGD